MRELIDHSHFPTKTRRQIQHKVPLFDGEPDIQFVTFKAGAGGHGSGIRVSLEVWWRKVKEGSGRGLLLRWVSPRRHVHMPANESDLKADFMVCGGIFGETVKPRQKLAPR